MLSSLFAREYAEIQSSCGKVILLINKTQGIKSYSIITDHLGTPVESYDEEGKKVWSRELNIYGETRKEFGEENFIPFLYQGQYLDLETELAYNRFRYYSLESGTYVSQDPIGLDGGMLNMYAFTVDVNTFFDPFGNEQITFRAAFNQAKRDLGIPKKVNTPQPVKVWDNAFENRTVWAFEGNTKESSL